MLGQKQGAGGSGCPPPFLLLGLTGACQRVLPGPCAITKAGLGRIAEASGQQRTAPRQVSFCCKQGLWRFQRVLDLASLDSRRETIMLTQLPPSPPPQAGKASCVDALADTANPCAASTCKNEKKKCVLQVGPPLPILGGGGGGWGGCVGGWVGCGGLP